MVCLLVGKTLRGSRVSSNAAQPRVQHGPSGRCATLGRLTRTLGVTEVLRCERVHPKNSQHGFVPRGVCVASLTEKNSGPASSASPSDRGHSIQRFQFRVMVSLKVSGRSRVSGEGRERFASCFLPPKTRASFASFGECFWKGCVSGLSRPGKR